MANYRRAPQGEQSGSLDLAIRISRLVNGFSRVAWLAM